MSYRPSTDRLGTHSFDPGLRGRPGTFPALVLNADYRPLLPATLRSWQDAITGSLTGTLRVVETYDVAARAAGVSIQLPSVVVLPRYHRVANKPVLNRRNLVRLRDRCACAYCGRVFPQSMLTLDHVIPRAQGGRDTWENLVASCRTCNSRKGARTPEQAGMPLQWRPWMPTLEELARVEFFQAMRQLHETWKPWVAPLLEAA